MLMEAEVEKSLGVWGGESRGEGRSSWDSERGERPLRDLSCGKVFAFWGMAGESCLRLRWKDSAHCTR